MSDPGRASQYVGKTIEGIIVTQRVQPGQQLFMQVNLYFSDGTSAEIFGENLRELDCTAPTKRDYLEDRAFYDSCPDWSILASRLQRPFWRQFKLVLRRILHPTK